MMRRNQTASHRGRSSDVSPQSSQKLNTGRRNDSQLPSSRLLDECVKVYIRIKPDGKGNISTITHTAKEVSITTASSLDERMFCFDEVFSCSTQTIFQRVCVPLLDNVLQNDVNACLLVYGQTGSGKTYTMGMLQEINQSDQGIVSMTLNHLFSQKASTSTIEMSFVQIYLEELDDLLNPNLTKRRTLALRRNQSQDPFIQGLVQMEVASYREAIQIVNGGLQYRCTGQQQLNQQSSRSHTVLNIYVNRFQVDSETGEQYCTQSKVQLVDLAGSERTKKSQSRGVRMEEAKHINQSLAALGNVVSALSNHNTKFIPFRDSKLTQVLQCSLQGQARVVLIGTISSSQDAESLSTLLFAQRCKQIKLRASSTTNERPSQHNQEQFYQEELKRVVGLFERRQKQQEEQIHNLEQVLSNQKATMNRLEDKGEQNELIHYLIKLLEKINQHTQKLVEENRALNEQINKNTMQYVVQELQQHNLNSTHTHNIMAISQLKENVDAQFPTTAVIIKELPQCGSSTSLDALVAHIQGVSQALLTQIKYLAGVARTTESMKQELVLHHFLQQQRELELDNWMKTVGYLYRMVQGRAPQKNLQEKIMQMINAGDFYQEMDAIKKRIVYHSASKDNLSQIVDSLRMYSNNQVFDGMYQDTQKSTKSNLKALYEHEIKKPPLFVPPHQASLQNYDDQRLHDLMKQKKQTALSDENNEIADSRRSFL